MLFSFGEGWEQRRQEICKTRAAGGKVLHRRRARQGNENKNLGERSTIERQDLDNRAAAEEFTIYPTPLLDQGLIIAF